MKENLSSVEAGQRFTLVEILARLFAGYNQPISVDSMVDAMLCDGFTQAEFEQAFRMLIITGTIESCVINDSLFYYLKPAKRPVIH